MAIMWRAWVEEGSRGKDCLTGFIGGKTVREMYGLNGADLTVSAPFIWKNCRGMNE